MSEREWLPGRPRRRHERARRAPADRPDGRRRGASSTLFPEVLAAVGELLRAEWAGIARYEPGCVVTIASWNRTGGNGTTGSRTPLEGGTVPTLVFETHRPALIDPAAAEGRTIPSVAARGAGLATAALGAPIRVGGLLWGLLAVAPIDGAVDVAGHRAARRCVRRPGRDGHREFRGAERAAARRRRAGCDAALGPARRPRGRAGSPVRRGGRGGRPALRRRRRWGRAVRAER